MTRRIAVSLSDHLYKQIERVRKARRVARSALIQEAVGDYMARNDERALEEQYFAGYERIPDGDDPDFIAIEKVGIESLKRARLP
jgi:metal-responsive CopG/Arc/MetJ family transcriptional regulator